MWNVETADMWGSRYEASTYGKSIVEKKVKSDETSSIKLLNAGMWKPFEGLVMNDVLFPHVAHGFRGRNFHIITHHVIFLRFFLGF